MPTKQITADRWQWFGMAGHLIVANYCQHHLCTRVGRYLISTVGNYYPDGKPNGLKTGRDMVGCDRYFETFVFDLGKKPGQCDCGCGLPTPQGGMSDIDALPANDEPTADKNHIKLCRKYARRS